MGELKVSSKEAILLMNLGTPDEPTAPAIARYLGEFLGDRRVVDIPKLLWYPILYGIILRKRPAKLAPKYAAIWEAEGAPLKAITARQAGSLQTLLQNNGDQTPVYFAMRYQNPSVIDVLTQMSNDGVTHFKVLPLYPQYSMTTTATADDALQAALQALSKNNRALTYTMVNNYHAHPAYIAALKSSIDAHWQIHGRPDFASGDKILLSFHGLPERNIARGDPYQSHCQKTHQLLMQALGLSEEQINIAYQSRFGAQKWLSPSTQSTLERLAANGTARVDVLCPGFSADCLETLEEINLELREVFVQKGGGTYHYIPCLNDNPAHIEMMRELTSA